MKWALGLLVFLSVNVFAADPAWYDEEIIHNTVHDLLELFDTPRIFTFYAEDTQRFRDAFLAAKKAAEHLHDQLEEKTGREAALEAGKKLEAPMLELTVATKANQIKANDFQRHRSHVLQILFAYTELKFLLTPVN